MKKGVEIFEGGFFLKKNPFWKIRIPPEGAVGACALAVTLSMTSRAQLLIPDVRLGGSPCAGSGALAVGRS